MSRSMADKVLTLGTVTTMVFALGIGGTFVLERLGLMKRPSALAVMGKEEEPIEVPAWERFAEGGHSLGPSNAPITIIEFGDYECPACRQTESHLEAVRRKYSTQLRFVYRHWPLPYHQYAYKVARAAECAAHQGRFWEYHRELFRDENWIGDAIVRFAENAGVQDLALFRACFEEEGPVPAIEGDIAAALEVGGYGTPTIVVNGLLIRSNVDSLSLFKMVNEALRE
jgi:protein-disulfide isomerase